MTFEEFKTACLAEVADKIKWVDLDDENENERLFGFIEGIDFTSTCFLPIRYQSEMAKLKTAMRKLIRQAKRDQAETLTPKQ